MTLLGIIGRARATSRIARVLAVAVAAAIGVVVLPSAANADVYQCRQEGGEYRSICADVTDVSGSLPLRLGAGYGNTVPGTAYHNGDALALACWTTGPADEYGGGDRYWLKVYDTVDTSVEGFVSDYNLTTGTTTAWQQHVTHCTDPVPQTGKPYRCRMQGGEYRSWCANVTAVAEDLWLPLDQRPGYTHGVVSGTRYHNGDALALGCWTTGPQDYGEHGDTYWFSVFDPNDPSIEGYVNDYSLTTGSPSDWKGVVSECQGTTPPPKCDGKTFRNPAHDGVPEALTREELRCVTPFTSQDTSADASALAGKLGRVSLARMMREGWGLTRPIGCERTLPPGNVRHFCWPGAEQFRDTLPQGLSSSADANGDRYEGHRYLAVSWHIGADVNGKYDADYRSRLTFVNMDGPDRLPVHRYKHVLLVEPTNGGAGCRPLGLHAGGLVWYGDKLFVADDDHRGIRVFDVRDLARSNPGRGCNGENYRYVLPEAAHYTRAVPSGSAGHMRVNYLSLDRDGGSPSLLVGEWQDLDKPDGHSLVVHYPLNSLGLLAAKDGHATASGGWRTGVISAQGALVHDGRLYMTASRHDDHGYLYTWDMTSGHSLTRHAWARDPENLTYRDGRLWNLSELIDDRSVFSVPESDYR